MKFAIIKKLTLSLLIVAPLWLGGCALSPQDVGEEPQTTEQKMPGPARAPAEGSDDMERLD